MPKWADHGCTSDDPIGTSPSRWSLSGGRFRPPPSRTPTPSGSSSHLYGGEPCSASVTHRGRTCPLPPTSSPRAHGSPPRLSDQETGGSTVRGGGSARRPAPGVGRSDDQGCEDEDGVVAVVRSLRYTGSEREGGRDTRGAPETPPSLFGSLER